jgi:acetyl esterase/lipase
LGILLLTLDLSLLTATPATCAEPTLTVNLWPGMAPGETTPSTGVTLPRRENETPPATRIGKITQPQLDRYEPLQKDRTGAAVLIFPGGGYNYVVVDKEGSEIASWLNDLGITAFVVRYRTKDGSTDRPVWERPLEDAQRAVSLVRSRAEEWKLDPKRIGVIGFSAGGQAAALVSTHAEQRSYPPMDKVDEFSCRPDFTLLVYPAWLVKAGTVTLEDFVPVSKTTPPAFLVHAHDDSVTPLSSVAYYTALKQHGVPAELHIYASGGHGYGLRDVAGSNVSSWPEKAEHWLKLQGFIHAP